MNGIVIAPSAIIACVAMFTVALAQPTVECDSLGEDAEPFLVGYCAGYADGLRVGNNPGSEVPPSSIFAPGSTVPWASMPPNATPLCDFIDCGEIGLDSRLLEDMQIFQAPATRAPF